MDLYRLLGVGRGADADELRRVYHKQCLRWHPDKAGPEGEARFKDLQNAYEILADPQRRREYDLTLPAERGTKEARKTRDEEEVERFWEDEARQFRRRAEKEKEEEGGTTTRPTRAQGRWCEDCRCNVSGSW
eukprot:Hpha_TRINITY_DN32017_c0_g1::TRINITY_DN32017_c0_g1_i1::g.115889::m.115889